MKYFLFYLLLPFPSQAGYDPFPNIHSVEAFKFHFTECLNEYSDSRLYPEDLKTDEDRTIFYSGCMFSLEQLRSL